MLLVLTHAAVLVSFCAQIGSAQSKETRFDAVRTIISEFNRATFVGLGELHSGVADSEFRKKLIRDREFCRKVNDIVVEFANPLYQSVLDRFVNGEDLPPSETDVPHSKLKVWQTGTQLQSAIYEELIDTVRAVNFGLPADGRLRVVAGFSRSNVEVIRREVLDKHHKALFIFGSRHFIRNSPHSLISLLDENDVGARWFVVASAGGSDVPAAIASHTATPSNPVLLPTNGTIGKVYAGYLLLDYNHTWDQSPGRVTLEQVIDAILYFGAAPIERKYR